MHNIAIVLAAGSGSRMHSDIPKQYLEICGKPVMVWSLETFEHSDVIQEIVLVVSPDDESYCREEIIRKYGISKCTHIVPGGTERYLSVLKGLRAAETDDYVFIHDAARPLADHAMLQRALTCVKEYQACVVGVKVKDTIKIADEEGFAVQTPDRRYLWQIQTPQVFSYPLVRRCYEKLIEDGITEVTDDAMVVEKESGVRIKLVEGDYRNIKITTPEDPGIAGLFLAER